MIKANVDANYINANVNANYISANVNASPIEVDNDKLKVVKGEKGAVFTPFVDEACNLSWSNNGGLPNPPTVNIKGDNGDATVTPITNIDIEAILRR